MKDKIINKFINDKNLDQKSNAKYLGIHNPYRQKFIME